MIGTVPEWEKFLEEGKSFHRIARGAQRRPGLFSAEIRMNLIGMAIEKYLMAIFLRRRSLPDNHTMTDLADAMKRIKPLPAEVESVMREMDDLQQICSPDEIRVRKPEEAENIRFLAALDTIAAIVESELALCAT